MIVKDGFDLAVVGAGPGGYVAAIRAAQLGLNTVIIEKGHPGGTCLNRGCIPTKTFLHTAELLDAIKGCRRKGIRVENPFVDIKELYARKDTIVKRMRKGIEYLLESNKVTYMKEQAEFIDNNTLKAGNEIIKAEKIIIAAGTTPFIPSIKGVDASRVFTSDGILDSMEKLPESAVIIGGGVIGAEFATILNSFGTRVTIIEMMKEIIPGFDSEISASLRKSLERKGVAIHCNATVEEIFSGEDLKCRFVKDGIFEEIKSEILIISTGRKPNSMDMGVELAGLKLHKGFIPVNDKMETAVGNIYAVGDITGGIQLAHMAMHQGMIAAENAAGGNEVINYNAVPSCIYTNPEIASTGLNEEQATVSGYKVKIGRVPLNINSKSVIMEQADGFVKIVADSNNDRILGAQIIGPRATDIIAELCMVIQMGGTLKDLIDTVHPHPTVSEAIFEAACNAEGRSVHAPPKI